MIEYELADGRVLTQRSPTPQSEREWFAYMNEWWTNPTLADVPFEPGIAPDPDLQLFPRDIANITHHPEGD